MLISPGLSVAEAWDLAARSLGTTQSDLARALAGPLRLQPANLATADAKAVRLIPERLARRHNVFPVRENDRQLIVATADPHDLECEQAIAFAAGRRVQFELAPPQQIAQAVSSAYAGNRQAERSIGALEAELADAVQVLESLRPDVVAAQDVETGPVVRMTNLIIRDTVSQRASDIHIEPGEGGGVVRFRIDGVMRQHMLLPTAALNRVVSRVKVLARLDIADRTRPHDGRTRVQVDGQTLDLRVSTVPIRDAEKAVIRLLRPGSVSRLDHVGLSSSVQASIQRLLTHRDGIVFVTGPTGSGKTTTLYGALGELRTGDVNITTIEDPVEYELPGVAQIQVDGKRGVTFASALRAILRQDPDVIFVGEIRDLETAEIAVQAAMTGHLVLATLHTNDAVGAIGRLADLGLDRVQIAATVRGSIAQRLIRRVCPDCAVVATEPLTPEEERVSRLYGVQPVARAAGCPGCAGSGYRGRVPIAEVACFTPSLSEMVAQGATAVALQRAFERAGMVSLRAAAVERVASGETTLAEIERVIGDANGASRSASDGTIFVVDDDAVERLLVTSVLRKNGFHVREADDGAVALEALMAGAECSLVVTDLHMKHLNGDELMRRLRADARTAAIPVVVLTGSAESETEEKLIDAGADDYIRKPLDPPKLLARVKAALRRAAA